jgi:malate dehydrogenase (oxaloacetate-decarboxylating)
MPTNHPTMAHFTRRMSSIHKETKPHEKHPRFGNLPLSTSGPQDCALTGAALLNTPYLNKGAGFPPEEREAFKLTGLLPQNVQTLDQQVKRAYQQYSTRVDDLAKNTFMTSLGEQNEVLYFRVSFMTPEYFYKSLSFPSELHAPYHLPLLQFFQG